jgi:hypothetical protein
LLTLEERRLAQEAADFLRAIIPVFKPSGRRDAVIFPLPTAQPHRNGVLAGLDPWPHGGSMSVAAARIAPVGPARLPACIRLKAPGIFSVSAPTGDIDSQLAAEQGVYFHDTRFLRQALVRIGGVEPVLEAIPVHRYRRCNSRTKPCSLKAACASFAGGCFPIRSESGWKCATTPPLRSSSIWC